MQTLVLLLTIPAASYLLGFALLMYRLRPVIKAFDLSKATKRGNTHVFPEHSQEASIMRGVMYATMVAFGAIGTLAVCTFIQLLIWIF